MKKSKRKSENEKGKQKCEQLTAYNSEKQKVNLNKNWTLPVNKRQIIQKRKKLKKFFCQKVQLMVKVSNNYQIPRYVCVTVALEEIGSPIQFSV